MIPLIEWALCISCVRVINILDNTQINIIYQRCFYVYLILTHYLARGRAAGLTSEAILEKLSSMQMIDVHLPTTDGRHIVMSRYTQPEKDVSLLLAQLGLTLPEQPPPKVYASGQVGL